MPGGELQLQEPPALPEENGGMSSMMYYAPTALGSMGMVLIFIRPGQSGPLIYIALGLMGLSAVAMMFTQLMKGASDRKRKMKDERRDYLRYLGRMRRQVRKAIDQQREAQAWEHPDPASLASVARTSRLWERRPAHPDFGEARIGVGPQRLGLTLAPLQTKLIEDLEPLSAHALRRFIFAYGTVSDQPIAAYLRAYARIILRCESPADLGAARDMVRSLLCQLAVFHSPDDLQIVVVTADHRRHEWEWTKWLPHALHPHETDAAGPVRLIIDAPGRLENLLGQDFAGRAPFDPEVPPSADEPYTVIVMDTEETLSSGHRLIGQGYRNAVLVDLSQTLGPKAIRRSLVLRVQPGQLQMVDTDPAGTETFTELGAPDVLAVGPATTVARMISPYRISTSTEIAEPMSSDVELTSLLGIPDLFSLDLRQLWEKRKSGAGRLRVPLGVTADGTPMELDIKEAAQGGMGPHGLLIGATGSGKSELLRTLVLALALTHSSETLNFVLVDFKGGATFLGLDQLPHTSAVITNLADEAGLVDRMKDSLQGELMRRQELLRSAGNYSSVLEYEAARASGTMLEPLPSLFLVVDEFSELLAANREFMDVFVMIGRLGRSLGVHLLLASQRLDEGRTSQLESHLSYRIGLRTFSAMESRGVLGVPDAYQLPSQPGNGFIRTDVTTLTRFRAAYVSGVYQLKERVEAAVVAAKVVAYGPDYVTPAAAPKPVPDANAPKPDQADLRSLLEVAAERLQDAGPPAHQVWLPPLVVPPTLDELLPPLAPDPERGLTTVDWSGQGRLQVPVGLIDRPYEQVRDLLMADLSGGGGHVGIAGGPQSGKSTLLRTLMTSLALTHSPREVQFYCLDFGGGTLAGLSNLPHVGGVTGRHDLERVNRTINEITSLIARREHQFAQHNIDSMADFRRRRAQNELPDEPRGDVFLVVDGWNTIKQDFPDLVPTFTLIAGRGLNYGVHLVVTANRWSEIITALRDQLGSRFELRLGDPVDSLINMRAARSVPKRPGAGITEEHLHFMTGLPRLDGNPTVDDLSSGVAGLVESVREWWTGPPAPPVRMLPFQVEASTLPPPTGDMRIALGLEENELAPFWHDFELSPHLIVIGDAETGKTNLLKLIAAGITQRYGPSEARVAVVDLRRELYDAIDEEHRLGYAVSGDVVRQIVEGTARALQTRVPGADITPAQLRRRDWWKGPQMFFIVDDYELIAGNTMDSPFGPLLDFLSQATEIGLHLIIARSANGASRAMSDPLLRRLLEVNTPTLLLSCPPSEGYIIGNVRARQLPPGRAVHITRRGTVQVQTALALPSAPEEEDVDEPSYSRDNSENR